MANIWYFAYGPNMDRSKLESKKINIIEAKNATLPGYSISNNMTSKDTPMQVGVSLTNNPNGFTEGIAYLIDEKSMKRIDKLEGYPKKKNKRTLQVQPRGSKTTINVIVYNGKLESGELTNDIKLSSIPTVAGFGGSMPFAQSKLKNSNRNFKWENNAGSGSRNFVMTFEQYQNKISSDEINEASNNETE